MDARHCEFMDYTGAEEADYWSFSDCLFAGERYCSIEDVQNMTDTELSRVNLGIIVEDATKRVMSKLLLYGISGGSGDQISAATLNLALVGVLTRYRIDGTKPASVTVDGKSSSDNVDQNIATLEARADQLIQDYVKYLSRTNPQYSRRVVKVNR